MTTSPGSQEAPAAAPGRLDPWLLAVIAAALLPLVKSWGAPLGEPVADDFDFLRRALLERGTLFDSGGAVIYWRPLARQIYYGALGPLMLSSPLAVALIHVAVLTSSAVLLYRAFHPAWGGLRAAIIATFPVIADSARVLLLWPAAFQDLGALLFCSLALHEYSRRRLPTTLVALLAALLCKEVAVVVAVLLPWMPEPAGAPRRDRKLWMLAIAGVVMAWGAAYALVLRSSSVMFQGHLEGVRPPLLQRWFWALGSSVADAFSLRLPPAWGSFALVTALALFIAIQFFGGAQARTAGRRAWILWGGALLLLCSLTLGETYPVWGSFRSTLGLVGLGILCVAVLEAVPAIGLAILVTARVVLLLLTPAAATRITADAPGNGSGFDFTTLTRLQRFSHETRSALAGGAPNLPQASGVTWVHRPLMTERAFAHSKALHVWYRDTTLQWVPWQDVTEARSARPIGAGIEFEPRGTQPIVLVDPAAVAEIPIANAAMRSDDYEAALAGFARADSLQRDRDARVFLSMVAGKRALCFLSLDDGVRARQEAERSMALWPNGSDARYVLAVNLATDGRIPEAMAQLDTLLSLYPFDPSARMLRDTLRVMGRGG